MKTSFGTLLLLLFAGFVHAQSVNLDSFYQPGSVWATFSYEYNTFGSPKSRISPRLYTITADSVISGQKVHIVTFQTRTEYKTLGAIRIAGERVYFRNLSSDTIYIRLYYNSYSNADAASRFAPGLEYLLYDYDIRVGDTLHWKPGWQRVVKIDSVLANGRYLRRFHFNEITAMDYSMDNWVEGVGSMLGFFGALDKPESSTAGPGAESHTYTSTYCGPKYHYSFIIGNLASSVYDTMNCSLKPLSVPSANPPVSKLRIFPNPGTGDEIHIELSGGMTDVKVFDLQGRMVAQYRPARPVIAATIAPKLPPALYIIKITLPDERILMQRYQRL